MMQYIVVLLDDTSVSFCHYGNSGRERRLMPLETLRAGVVYAMKENLNIQFVYPSYELPSEYREVIDSVDHTDIKPAEIGGEADVVVFNDWNQTADYHFKEGVSYVLRTDRINLISRLGKVCDMLRKVGRLNIVIVDVDKFTEEDFTTYAKTLHIMAEEVERQYVGGHFVQLNLLTDRMMLDKMNNCGAGDTALTLAPDGKFYVCPAFYFAEGEDAIGRLKVSVGDVHHGLEIKNPQLYRLDHAPICRGCDAYQCKRCIWLNRKTTYEVNTPSREQCVVAHLERNASRELMLALRRMINFLPERDEIKEIKYLDPFEVKRD